jgi:hypothetical protein
LVSDPKSSGSDQVESNHEHDDAAGCGQNVRTSSGPGDRTAPARSPSKRNHHSHPHPDRSSDHGVLGLPRRTGGVASAGLSSTADRARQNGERVLDGVPA